MKIRQKETFFNFSVWKTSELRGADYMEKTVTVTCNLTETAGANARFRRCLNGAWAFQPVAITGEVDAAGVPVLPPPADNWSEVPLIVPSPWNGNDWGGTTDPADPAQRYWTDGVHYPSYPNEWTGAKMGWLRRTFVLSAQERGGRLVLQFDAVAGDAVVLVNGCEVARHFDSYLPFEADITDAAHEGENELLVGVRSHRLFDRQSAQYAKMHRPYPVGSNTEGLCGIWQDVWLCATPAVYVADVFVQPQVAADTLRVTVTAANRGSAPQTVTAQVRVRRWDTGEEALCLPPLTLEVPAGGAAEKTVEMPVNGALSLWSPDTPVLYTAECALDSGDSYAVRFGWRQFTIDGERLLLNGEPIRLVGDICHPFGPYMFKEEWVRCWFNLIKEVGGNAVRLHAQPHPALFLDVADEMGLAVLDETALFGSSLSMNLEEPAAWERFEQHVNGLVRRDRNHPSVFGWSFGNELFALFLYDDAAKRDQDGFYERIIALSQRPRALDPTRDFITCDGDEDLRGTLPVWSKHFGHGLHPLPQGMNKPLVIGESGGTYYARPEQLAVFCGEQVYENYAGRNHALGIDVYQNIRHMGQKLAYFSPSELTWFGLEPLPYGYHDFTRLPNAEDGVFFPRPAEGTPGVYAERVPPFAGTLNPGWDDALPAYRPLDMFYAMRDALTCDSKWDEKWAVTVPPLPAPPSVAAQPVRLVGDQNGAVARALRAAGLVLSESAADVLIDTATADEEQAKAAWEQCGGRVLALLLDTLPVWLSLPVSLTDREATQLTRAAAHPYVASLAIAEMYTAESRGERRICRRGLDVSALPQAQVLLAAGEADWSQFNDRPERVKCGATFLHERLQKPAGAVLVQVPCGKGERLLTTAMAVDDEAHRRFWRRLFQNMGWALGAECGEASVATGVHDLLLNGPVEE